MECTVLKVTPFTPRPSDEEREPRSSNAVAAVTLAVGPVSLRVRLYQREEDQRMWLQMPGRKTEDDKWFDYIHFRDEDLKKSLEARAVELYRTTRSDN